MDWFSAELVVDIFSHCLEKVTLSIYIVRLQFVVPLSLNLTRAFLVLSKVRTPQRSDPKAFSDGRRSYVVISRSTTKRAPCIKPCEFIIHPIEIHLLSNKKCAKCRGRFTNSKFEQCVPLTTSLGAFFLNASSKPTDCSHGDLSRETIQVY